MQANKSNVFIFSWFLLFFAELSDFQLTVKVIVCLLHWCKVLSLSVTVRSDVTNQNKHAAFA